MPLRLDASAPGFEKEFSAFLGRNRDTDENVDRVAAEIVADVRARGDAALVEYTRKFDKVETDAAGLRLSDAERKAAAAKVPAAQREALAFAAQRIEAFHRALLPKDVDFTDATGTRLGARYRPIDSVGVYVPGGTAAYPSSVLMNVVPAKVAGVPRIVMVVPTPGGALNPLVMLAAEIAGADEVWRIGGAQAMAALAYGTQSIRPVDKITGPGNAYVAAAKRRVFGQVGIDLIAGPSEILVVADAAERSGLDRGRPPVAGRARCLLAVGADRRRCRLRRRRGAGRGERAQDPGARATSPARAGATTAAIILVPDACRLLRPSSIASPPSMSSWRWKWRLPRRWPTRSAMPARSSSAATRPRRSATMSPAPTTCCRPRARRASRAGWASPISSSAPRWWPARPRRWRRSAPAALALAEAEGLGAHGRSVSIRLNRRA